MFSECICKIILDGINICACSNKRIYSSKALKTSYTLKAPKYSEIQLGSEVIGNLFNLLYSISKF